MTTIKKVASKKSTKTTMVKKVKKDPLRDHTKSKRVLVCAEGDQCFWTTDGKVIANLVELKDALSTMGKEIFEYHVTSEKNDFADWIQYVLGDTELATKIRVVKKSGSAHTVVVSRLKIYDL